MKRSSHVYGGPYEGDHLNYVAFPMGGMGAGMVCLEGSGGLTHVSIQHRPQVFHEPLTFAALAIAGRDGEETIARVLEGPVAGWKATFPWGHGHSGGGNGGRDHNHGLPRFRYASFQPRFPFAAVDLTDPGLPVTARVTGWSPFTPGRADDASLPVAALEYTITNTTDRELSLVWSFHARNFLAPKPENGSVRRTDRGFVLASTPTAESPVLPAELAVQVDAESVSVDPAWFRGGWFDPLTITWNNVAAAKPVDRPAFAENGPSPGGSVYVPLELGPGQSDTVRMRLTWYVPQSELRAGTPNPDGACTCNAAGADCETTPPATYVPWYAGRFESLSEVCDYWSSNADRLRSESDLFATCLEQTTLPPEVMEAVAANLTILKSPTVLRQTDGRLWNWEGCCDGSGCCHGSCTHVWNYAQALPHLFPDLERSLRQTEFHENQNADGHQTFRANLPISPTPHGFHAAADGQLGGILKVYRDWRISGNNDWLKNIWPKVRDSIEYCIRTWDPDENGALTEPHHNTYDIEFWGADGMCTSFYLAALHAAALMAEALGEDNTRYRELCDSAVRTMNETLFNGDYYIQKTQWTGLRAEDPVKLSEQRSIGGGYSPEAVELLKKEGPKYQYGTGCLSDGVLGIWMAEVCGLTDLLDPDRVRSHLLAVYTHNLRKDLSAHANPQRPSYAFGEDGGLLLCTWPNGGKPSLPFVYSDEVWTGIEYQAASHLMIMGCVSEGLDIVRAARDRYDGRKRNPFDEYECGHWYARALASYALIQGMTGLRFDAVEKRLYMDPGLEGDWQAFIATATGFGMAGIKDGRPFLKTVFGEIPVQRIQVRDLKSSD